MAGILSKVFYFSSIPFPIENLESLSKHASAHPLSPHCVPRFYLKEG